MIMHVNITSLVIQFLNRMQSNVYEARPDDDEVLRFFTTLNLLITVYDIYHQLDETDRDGKTDLRTRQIIYIAQLGLLLTPYWHSTLTEEKLGPHTIQKTFAHFDFETNLTFCESVLSLLQQDSLTKSLLTLEFARTILFENLPQLVSRAIVTHDWNYIVRLLLPMDRATIAIDDFQLISQMTMTYRPHLSKAYLNLFRTSVYSSKEEDHQKLMDGTNVLGAILMKPTASPSLYRFFQADSSIAKTKPRYSITLRIA